MTDRRTVGVVGLGSMGYGMAQSLLRAGHVVHGFDMVTEQVDRFRAEGGARGTLVDIAKSLDALVIVVLNAAQAQGVLFSAGKVAGNLRPGAVVVGCTTMPPQAVKGLATLCQTKGVLYLDAPISGGAARAAEGRLTVLASGTPEAFAAAKPVLDATAETVLAVGDEPGAGSAMKAVNQLLAGVHIAAMAEALTFAMTQGIAPAQFLEVIRKCAGTSWMLENRAPHVVEGDYTPRSAVDIWPKDLGIVLEIAAEAKFSAPLAAAALQQFLAAAGSGLGREDDAAVAKVYARNAGLTLPGQR
jgi:putative dehydrogenase